MGRSPCSPAAYCHTNESTGVVLMVPDADDYLAPEARARIEIDEMLEAAGWAVQDYGAMALGTSKKCSRPKGIKRVQRTFWGCGVYPKLRWNPFTMNDCRYGFVTWSISCCLQR